MYVLYIPRLWGIWLILGKHSRQYYTKHVKDDRGIHVVPTFFKVLILVFFCFSKLHIKSISSHPNCERYQQIKNVTQTFYLKWVFQTTNETLIKLTDYLTNKVVPILYFSFDFCPLCCFSSVYDFWLHIGISTKFLSIELVIIARKYLNVFVSTYSWRVEYTMALTVLFSPSNQLIDAYIINVGQGQMS